MTGLRISRWTGPRRLAGGRRGAIAALGAVGCVLLTAALAATGFASDAELREPAEFVSDHGVLRARLVTAETPLELAGEAIIARAYNGAFVGPTLRARPGDRLEIELVNTLPEPTNIHFHGLHVSPSGDSDNIFREIAAGETAHYVIDLPTNHPSGTFWYHSHQHHLSEEQVFGGLSGLIVIDGLVDLLPPELRGIAERSIVLKDFQVKDGAIEHDNIDSDAPTTRVVNGQRDPHLVIAPGETQLWRLANIGADIWYELHLDGHEFHVIAEDGNPVWTAWSGTSLVLPPGKRFDVLVQGGTPGDHVLETLAYDQGGDQYPKETLATLTVSGAATLPVALPSSLVPRGDLATAAVDKKRTLVFTERDEENIFMIDGKTFDPNRIDQVVQLGAVEEWTVRNETAEQHPFHIHVDDFEVMAIDGAPFAATGLQDTVSLPIQGDVVFRIRFADFTGKFVYHCHILNHEDNGMMGVVEVVE